MTIYTLSQTLEEINGQTAVDIFESIRLLAQQQRLPEGTVLPSVRDLAQQLDVNRNTVASAYKRLVAANIAMAQGRNGTVIRGPAPAGEQEGTAFDSPLVDLASGNPNPAWLPDPLAALAGSAYQPTLYGEPVVDAVLEGHARRWMADDCPGDFAIHLTHGAVDAVERLLSAYLVPGDRVAVEDPCFLSSINTLRTSGLQAVGVTVDASGMRADRLEEALAQGAQAVIVTPRAHNPTGYGLSESRARDIRKVLGRYPHVMVIIDDHFALLAEVPYRNVLPKGASRWALVRSVSKVLGPDLRVAVVASDASTAQRLQRRLAPGTNWVSHLLQRVVIATLFAPGAPRWIAAARRDYASRRQQLADALASEGIKAALPADGLNLWIPLPGSGQPAAAALAQRGWLVRGGDAFSAEAPSLGLRITVSTMDADEAGRFARDLRHVLAR